MWSIDFLYSWKELYKTETGKNKILFVLGTPFLFVTLLINDVLEWIDSKG